MAFDSLGRYTATHKPYDHFGNLIPEVEVSEGIRPHFPFKPAAWLPVVFYDKHFEQYNVVMPGKLVALDPDGRVMPAEYGLTSASVTYTANDVTVGTIDITTGDAVTSAKTVTLSQVDGTTYGFMGRAGKSFADATRKFPIGVAPYAYLQWAGDGSADDDGFNPAALREHNYNMQHQVAVLCDFVIKLPLIPGQVAAEALPNNWTDSTITFGTKAWHTRANVRLTARYSSTGYMPVTSTTPVIALALDNYPVAKNTTRTPITSTVTGLLTNEVTAVNSVRVAGDWYIDNEVGVLFVYSADGQTLPTIAGNTVTYFHYATAPGVYSIFACVLGTTTELVPGDYLGVAAASNWSRLAVSASTLPPEICGQVLGFEKHPMDALDRVRTAFSPALRTNSTGAMSNATLATSSVGLGQMDQMPGSANGGYPDTIHYAGASDTLVVINLVGR